VASGCGGPICTGMNQDDEAIRAALAALPDPKGRGDLVSAGRVPAIRSGGGVATLVVDATGLGAGERAVLEARIRDAVGQVAGIAEVRVAMSADKIERTIIAIGSGKGGVGKSTVSANLAIALARAGRRVGLVDADIYGPSQPRIMGNSERPAMIDKQIVAGSAHGIRMLSIGQMVESGKALALRGPMAASALGQMIEGDWGDCDTLVVDLPPGTGDVQLSLIQKWKPAGAVIVSTPQDLALIDATRAIDLFRQMAVPVFGLIENMAGYACPHCGEISDPFGSGGAEAAARTLEIPFLGRIPLTLSIRRASDEGNPPAAGEGEEAAIFARLAERLLAEVNRTAA
jgi:ATP-binding protein involved in chromosome partitioning